MRADIESVIITGPGPVGLGMLAMTKLLLSDATPVLIADMIHIARAG
jgi:threonine 3-dehydrogenase